MNDALESIYSKPYARDPKNTILISHKIFDEVCSIARIL